MMISFKIVKGRVIMRWNTYMLLLFSMITFPSSMPNPRSTLADSIVGSIRIEMFVEIFLYMKFSVSTGSWNGSLWALSAFSFPQLLNSNCCSEVTSVKSLDFQGEKSEIISPFQYVSPSFQKQWVEIHGKCKFSGK